MNYTKEKIIEMTGTDIVEHGNWVKDIQLKDDFLGADTFWLSPSATRLGKTTDTSEHYSEVVGKFLLENGFIEQDNFTGIRQITRKKSYATDKAFTPENSDLVRLFKKFEMPNKFGRVIELSIPLENYADDKAGVIDLLSYKEDTNELFIVQVKPHCSNETLLGAALEIQTYYQTMDKEKLIADFYSTGKIKSKNLKIKKVLVLLSESNAYNEAQECRPVITEIINKLNIEIESVLWDWRQG